MASIRDKDIEEIEINTDDVVFVSGFEYHVKLEYESGFKVVTKNRVCSCGETKMKCAHVKAVAAYLKGGGQRAPDHPALTCPICGGKIFVDQTWADRDTEGRRIPGWRCENGGLSHFLEAKAERVKKRLAENPWLFLPVYDESGVCVYPGVRRDEIMTAEQCTFINQRIYQETGYDPRA